MKALFNRWDSLRWVRLGLALALLGAAIGSGDHAAYLAAAFFGIQAVFNVSCFGASCATAACDSTAHKGTNVTFNEVDR